MQHPFDIVPAKAKRRITARWRSHRLSGAVVFCLLLGLLEVFCLGVLLWPRYVPARLGAWQWPGLVILMLVLSLLGWSMAGAQSRGGRRVAVLFLLALVLAVGCVAAHAFAWHVLKDSLRKGETLAYLALSSRTDVSGPQRFIEEHDLMMQMIRHQPGLLSMTLFAWGGVVFAVALPWIIACFTSGSQRLVVTRQRPQ